MRKTEAGERAKALKRRARSWPGEQRPRRKRRQQ